MGRVSADHAPLAGAQRKRWAGGPGRPVEPAHALPAPNASGSGGDGARNASSPSLLGSASNRLRIGSQTHPAGALRVGGLSVPGAGCSHRPDQSTPAPRDLEALGAELSDGAVAAGRRAWL